MADSPLAIDSLHLRLAAANGLIRRRRSIKPEQMSDEAVDPMILGNILENANWAPTHGMTQPWRFKVYEEDGREPLADGLQRIYRETTPKAAFRQDKHDGIRTKIFAAPVVIVICMARQESGVIPELEEVEAVACAVQNMHLTASAVGMAAYWSSPVFVYTDEMKVFLRLNPGDRCLGLFYLGWPKEKENWPKGTRSPIQERLEWFE
ncbi:MAG: Nitroreductase [Verrucomicrobia bacterium]|jgi:nitroreductase|nr:MAG: Nitroreductase [Verrucomicrobiota bacterium]